MNAITATTQRISIAMATYNGATYLLDQLDSLAAQTLLPYELVVTDDGSTDATLEILDAFARRALFPVHIHHNPERVGYRDNFLKAARLCTGDLIAFCDQDDYWLPEKLETVSKEFIAKDILLAVHDFYLATANLEKTRYVKSPSSKVPFSGELGFAMVFRRELSLSEKINLPMAYSNSDNPYPINHDQWIAFLASSFGKCSNIRLPLVYYRQHANNTFGFGKKKHFLELVPNLLHVKPLKYKDLNSLAKSMADSIRYIASITDFPDRWKARALASIIKWEKLAKFHLFRYEINKDNSSFINRNRYFYAALLQYGYSKKYLGHKALLKDAFVALFGTKSLTHILMFIKRYSSL
jgi:glycosyltransferase involved in cell wall biosynthesis